MNRQYQYLSQSLAIAVMAITNISISPAWAQTQPRRGDADQLRPAQGKSITPTNTNEFSPNQELSNTNLQIQNINFEAGTIEPVIPGNNNASPQKVNKSGNFSSDPLNAIQIFQESGTSRRGK